MSKGPPTQTAATASERASLVVATWFGAGLSPRAPGTVGSLASLVLWGPLVMLDTPWWVRVAAAVVVFAVGVAASNVLVRARGEDPQIIVIDEVAGMGITLALASSSYTVLAIGFVCFRVFDIWKPWPVSWADQQVGGGLGVMLDDVVAGGYALAVLVVIEHFVLPLFGSVP